MNEDKKYAQISTESIQTWAETVGVTDLSSDVLRMLGADATYRLHQILNICNKYLSHCNKRKLTSDDFNRALRLMDVSPVYGYSGSETVEWVSVPELGVFTPHDPPVNLASTALSGDIFHQPGNTYVKAKWAHVSGHLIMESESNAEEKSLSSLPLSSQLVQYYRALFSVTTNPSSKLFEEMCSDIETSTNIGPLVGPIIRSVLKGAQKASQKPLILRRLLLIVRALLFNPYIHLGPQNYIHDIVNVLVFSVVTERKNPQDTQSIRTLAANILLKLSRKEGVGATAWEFALNSLAGVVGSSTRPWTQHAGALTGLIPLGYNALHRALMPVLSEYYTRLCQALSSTQSATISSAMPRRDTIDANMAFGLLLVSMVNMMVAFLKNLPEKHKIFIGKNQYFSKSSSMDSRDFASHNELIQKIKEVYYLGEEMFGSAFVLQVPRLYLYCGDPPYLPQTTLPPSFPEMLSDVTLFSEFDPPPQKRPKIRERCPLNVKTAFENYCPIVPVHKRKIYMSFRGCSTRKFEFLKQKKGLLPDVKQHPHRELLVKHKTKTGRMPHWTFIRPMCRPPRPCSSLNYVFL